MYAIVDVGGRQVRVEPDEHVKVPYMEAEVGSQVTFDRVYAVRSNGDFRVGTPTVEGAKVVADVVAHGKSKKVLVYKYKRRKFYRRRRGHRQLYTEIKISEIVV
jgi:large subunit ribosomal protein L21